MRGVTVVFDLDGTMVDTAPDLIAALDHLFAKLGLPPSDPAVALPAVGHGARAIIDAAVNAIGYKIPPEGYDPLVEQFVAYYRENIAVKSRAFPGFEKAAQALITEGAVLAVCTNKREDLARKLLNELNLSRYFQAVVGGDTLAVRKPHPRHVLGAISAAGGDPARAVMVGDSAADVGAAKAAGVPVVAVQFGYSAESAQALGADVVITHFDQLFEIVRGLLARADS
jgi:phosphoglycolate phosphatase